MSAKKRSKKKKNSALLIGIVSGAVILVLGIVIFITFMISGSSKKENLETTAVVVTPPADKMETTTAIQTTTAVQTSTERKEETTAAVFTTAAETTTTAPETTTEEETTIPLREPAYISISAVGDNLVHSQIYDTLLQADGTYNFSNVYDQGVINHLSSADITIINQETPAMGNEYGVSTYPNFNAPTESIDSLINILGADVLTLATNHSIDKGDLGLVNTLNYIHTKHPEVLTTGTFESPEVSQVTPIIEVKGVKIAVLDYTYDLNGHKTDNAYEVNIFYDTAKVEADFNRAKAEADFIIACIHWGTEYSLSVNDTQRAYAQYLADCGAGLIIGTHPHVPQEIGGVTSRDGRYVPVYYSLGNFFSAQNHHQRILGEIADVQLYVDEYGNVSVVKVDVDFVFTYYTVNPDWVFQNFRLYMLRDVPASLAETSGVKVWDTEYTLQQSLDIVKRINPNWTY